MTLRRIVEGFTPVDFNKTTFISLINSVVNRIDASGVRVDLEISGEPEQLPVSLKEYIYTTCQEALTNSIIHGKAENIFIMLDCQTPMLKLKMVDNGRGCESISKNNGLTSMENRIKNLGGRIRFGSPSSGGFSINAEIPVKGGEIA
jgi:signal transduction histidine kinase